MPTFLRWLTASFYTAFYPWYTLCPVAHREHDVPGMTSTDPSAEPIHYEPMWPPLNGHRPIFLVDAASGLEERLLRAWIERRRPAESAGYDVIRLPPARRRRRRRPSLSGLEACLAVEGNALLIPLRVAWLSKKRNGVRSVRLQDLLALTDPRDPGPLRQAWIVRRWPDRCRIVAAEPATISELRARWQNAGNTDASQTIGLAEFVARQAELALERGERRLRGARYKVPRFVREDILRQASFRGGIARLARELGKSRASLLREATRYLREMAAAHSPLVIDLVGHLTHVLYTQGYGDVLHYDRAQLEHVKALSQRYPVAFLPSHKSNLDHLVLQYALHENGHPPNHTAGGINMNFFPVGPLVRRSGTFFIRRSFKDNPVYKLVLHHYIDYLIEKRFSLEWYIEGGRSRSGKLLPPRFGLLAYLADAYRRGKADDVMLIPVSIAYDQIQDIGAYAAEQSGAPKERESFGWFVRVVRRLRRPYGDIHFRFGEAISVAQMLGRSDPTAEPNPDERSLAIQKLAFEVAVRINRVTPITGSSLVTLALLGGGDRAYTVDEVTEALHDLLQYVRTRNLSCCGDLDLDDPRGVRRALDALERNGVVSRFTGGAEPVYRIGAEQQLAAAYYRNTVIHFFVNASICELALLRAAEDDVTDPVGELWAEAMRLRDLLKFEFFFAEKDEYRGELRDEITLHDDQWAERLQGGSAEIKELVQRFRPFFAHRVLRPFVEAYRLVGDHLEHRDPAEPYVESRSIAACMGLGKQYYLQRCILSTASVSQVLIQNALRLAGNRQLLQPGDASLRVARRSFAEEIRAIIRRIDAVDALAASRRVGLIE
jgi:glycerol-3-phosphate O-acyltransferase